MVMSYSGVYLLKSIIKVDVCGYGMFWCLFVYDISKVNACFLLDVLVFVCCAA